MKIKTMWALMAAAIALILPGCAGLPPGDRQTSATGIVSAWIPPGTFVMGSHEDEIGHWPEEGPQHRVRISEGFWMMITPVTQSEWEAVMGNNPSHFQGAAHPPAAGEVQGRRPVERVSWYDVLVFANRLSKMDGLTPVYRIKGSTNPADWGAVPRQTGWDGGTPIFYPDPQIWNMVEIADGNGWRLPTEAQWEYAARAGTRTAFNDGTQDWRFINAGTATGWFFVNSNGRTREVGRTTSNAWGLYDKHGNVWEWVWCTWRDYTAEPQTDPSTTYDGSLGTFRVIRGPSWLTSPRAGRSAFRFWNEPSSQYSNLGFRLLRPDHTTRVR